VSIPIHGALKVVLDEVQSRRIAPTFLLNQFGKPRTARGPSTMFVEWVPCHAHGLRKTFNTIAAEAGCTPHELMTLSGHQTLGEVTRYTAAADRKKLAAESMKKIEMRTARGNPDQGFPKISS
jgi:integrase/recombinase XerD